MDTGTPDAAQRWRRTALWAGAGIVLFLGLGAYAWKGWRPAPPAPKAFAGSDPRWTYATPFRNVRPDVPYVGDAACAGCHKDESDAYRQHPMGRSFAPVSAADLDEAAGARPFEKFGSTFLVERRGEQLYHVEVRRDAAGLPVVELATPVHYTMGSGSRGKSYLVNRDGFLFQSPVSWFAQKNGWDASPGFAEGTHLQRTVDARCLFCHCNDAAPVENTLNRYREPAFRQHAIGCERCHGPGELHVRERTEGFAAGKVDDTIVNPRHLEPALREAVCQQCHLQGESRIVHRGRHLFDYRPGLPLELFWSVFVRRPELTDNYKAVSQVEQLAVSRCFQESNGELGCISCHDPHRLPAVATKVAYYRDRCLKCHERHGCSLPLAERRATEDNCAACHMPRVASADIAHTAVSDHRILRQPDQPPRRAALSRANDLPVVSFFGPGEGSGREEVERDLGLALVTIAVTKGRHVEQMRDLAWAAAPLLDRALQTWPADLAAWEAKGNALHVVGRWEEALAAFEEALVRAPQREASLAGAALTAEELRRSNAAIAYWRRVITVDPYAATAHARLATLLGDGGRWREAFPAAQAVVGLNPFAVEPRVFLALCHYRLGDAVKAREEFATVEALNPPDLATMRRWFERQLQSSPPE